MIKSTGGQPVNIMASVYLISPVPNLDDDQVGNQELFDLFKTFDYINRQYSSISRHDYLTSLVLNPDDKN